MNNNGNNNGFRTEPVRRYPKKRRPDWLRTAAVLTMTAILIAFAVVFIMSLAGTGLFADKEKPSVTPGGTTEPQGSTSEVVTTEPVTTTDNGSDDPDEIKYTYLDKTADDMASGLLVLIDEKHIYRFLGGTTNFVNLYEQRPADGAYQLHSSQLILRAPAVTALKGMATDLVKATGYTELLVAETYRDFDYQSSLHQSSSAAASPGASDYHSGATLRLTGWNAETGKTVAIREDAATWLKENAHKYGFIFRSPSSKSSIVGYSIEWQIRYVGEPHATYMYENQLCLEEYLSKLSTDYLYGGEHLIVEGKDGFIYEIFYVKGSSDGIVRLPVPQNRSYTVSGDNSGGFIVTVVANDGQTSTGASSQN